MILGSRWRRGRRLPIRQTTLAVSACAVALPEIAYKQITTGRLPPLAGDPTPIDCCEKACRDLANFYRSRTRRRGATRPCTVRPVGPDHDGAGIGRSNAAWSQLVDKVFSDYKIPGPLVAQSASGSVLAAWRASAARRHRRRSAAIRPDAPSRAGDRRRAPGSSRAPGSRSGPSRARPRSRRDGSSAGAQRPARAPLRSRRGPPGTEFPGRPSQVENRAWNSAIPT